MPPSLTEAKTAGHTVANRNLGFSRIQDPPQSRNIEYKDTLIKKDAADRSPAQAQEAFEEDKIDLFKDQYLNHHPKEEGKASGLKLGD